MIVVVAIDGSETGLRALRRAQRLTDWLKGDLHVLHVTHLPPIVLAAVEHAPMELTEIEDNERRLVWIAADEILGAEQVSGNVVRVDERGYPPDVIVEYAAKVGADLIVVGSRGRGDLASLVLGSTSHRVLNTATCDVLVVKGDGE